MARQRAVAALALGAGLLVLVGRGPVFVAPSASGAAARSAAPRTQMNAVDESGLTPGGPLVAYAAALAQAAAKKGESVPVTKDLMKIKRLYKDMDWMDELMVVVDNPQLDAEGKAKGMAELMQPLESSVVPKFLTFLSKSRRLDALRYLADEYLATLYETQQIVAVSVASAQPLTEEQKETIKEKMKARTGASDIKLVCNVDSTLIAGLKISYNFVDQESMAVPTLGMDMTMKAYLEEAALRKGVVDAL